MDWCRLPVSCAVSVKAFPTAASARQTASGSGRGSVRCWLLALFGPVALRVEAAPVVPGSWRLSRGATLAGVVLRLGDHGFDRRRLAAPCPAPRRAKRARPAVRNAKSAFSWRYPTRTPARVRITSPPTAGRATAASAASETATGRSWSACRGNDRTPIGMAPLGAGGAIPGSDDARPASLIAPKVDAPERRRQPEHRRCLPIRSATGSTPAMPNEKEERSDCSCVGGTTAPATDVSMS